MDIPGLIPPKSGDTVSDNNEVHSVSYTIDSLNVDTTYGFVINMKFASNETAGGYESSTISSNKQ
jgi:hypothetical protein